MRSSIHRRAFLVQSMGAFAAAGLARPGQARESGSDSSKWRIGCYTRPWAEYDYREAFDAIAEAGFQYVGLMTSTNGLLITVETGEDEARAIGEEAAKRGLKIPSAYGGNIPVRDSLEEGIAGLKRLIDNCAAAGSETVLMGGTPNADIYDVYFKAIAECCDYAAGKGVGIRLKPHGGLNATGPQCREAVEMVNHPAFSLWYDPGNIYYYSNGELDPVKDAASVKGVVTGMCVKDYRHPKDVSVTPGDGQVDFPAVFKALAEGGFTGGPLVIETLAKADKAGLLEEAKKARKYLESILA